MLVYIVSLITGAIVGYIGSKLFKNQGWGVVENSIAAAVGGLVGNMYLAQFFHSLGNFYIVNSLPAIIGASILLLFIMFAFSYESNSD